MPFQSEKQRRYLWANEPEIARDWTDTYGSGIARALGGRIGFWNGSGNIRQQPHQPRDLLVQNNPYGTRPRYQPPGGGATSLGSGRDLAVAEVAAEEVILQIVVMYLLVHHVVETVIVVVLKQRATALKTALLQLIIQ